jgi:hypothetical protein
MTEAMTIDSFCSCDYMNRTLKCPTNALPKQQQQSSSTTWTSAGLYLGLGGLLGLILAAAIASIISVIYANHFMFLAGHVTK